MKKLLLTCLLAASFSVYANINRVTYAENSSHCRVNVFDDKGNYVESHFGTKTTTHDLVGMEVQACKVTNDDGSIDVYTLEDGAELYEEPLDSLEGPEQVDDRKSRLN